MRKREAESAGDDANLYRRGSVWWGRIWIQGREIRWSLRTSDKEIAKRRVEERRKQELSEAALDASGRTTWVEAVASWADHIVGNIGPKTIQRYIVSLRQVEKWLKPLYLDEITRKILADMVRERKAAGASNATIRRDLTAVSSVLDHAIDNEWKDDNPALLARRRLKERRDPIVLPEVDHINFVISRAPGNMAHLIFAALRTGCRQNELATAERRHIDHARRQLAVYKTKRSKPRFIELDEETYERLAGIPPALGSPLLFYHSGGEPYRVMPSRWRELMIGCMKAAAKATDTGTGTPFRRFRFHDLRHRHAVDYLKNGGSIYDLSKRLGHTSVSTTEIYLAYLTPEEEVRAKAGHGPEPAQRPAHNSGSESPHVDTALSGKGGRVV